MISFYEAQKIVLENSKPIGIEKISLLKSIGKFLAEDVIAKNDVPHFSSSAVDGFAVSFSDIESANKKNPITLPIVNTIKAGDVYVEKLLPQTAIKIMTGSQIPKNTNCIIPKEDVKEISNSIVIEKTFAQFCNIRFQGEEIQHNEIVFQKETQITSSVIALLASLGFSEVLVFKTPSIAVITTGNELLGIEEELQNGKIRDANFYFLSSALSEIGFYKQKNFQRISDDKNQLEKIFKEAIECDIVIITGGISVGDFDFVKEILLQNGVEEKFWKINIKPGKPIFFGTKNEKLIFALPGNPVAVEVLFYEFIYPSLFKILGKEKKLISAIAKLNSTLEKKNERLEFLRASVKFEDGKFVAYPFPKQQSHMLHAFSKSNSLLLFDATKQSGEDIVVHLLPNFSFEKNENQSEKISCGKIIALNTSKKKGIPKTNMKCVKLLPDFGIEGDAHGGNWHRQISFLALESIEKMRMKGLNVRPGAFAENITTEFLNLPKLEIGDKVFVGKTEMEITQIGKECHLRCAIYYAAGDCVMPREGIFARVINGGEIKVGDELIVKSQIKL